jgi:hypothetical protein
MHIPVNEQSVREFSFESFLYLCKCFFIWFENFKNKKHGKKYAADRIIYSCKVFISQQKKSAKQKK